MKAKQLFIFLALIFTFSITLISNAQDNSENLVKPERWNLDVRSLPPIDNNSTLQYTPLPVDDTFIEEPETIRYEYTPNGIVAISSSSRILPRTSTQSEVIITRHPLNPMILFASANVYPVYGGQFNEGVYVSTNGGTTWFGKDSCEASPSNTHVGDPGPIITKNGIFIMTHLRLNYGTGQLTGMDANRSTDNGLTWSPSVTLLGGSQDKNMATADDAPTSAFYGRAYCVWSRFTASSPPIAISYSTNDGTSWSVATDINVPAASHYSQGCDIRTGPGGEVYVCWANPGSGLIEDNCGFAKSVNGGVSWVINTNVAFDMNGIRGTLPTVNNIRVNSFPRIDVDRTCGPYAGRIYIVVSQKNLAPAGTDPDIVIHSSSNGGTSWSAGIKVNQDALNNGKIQYFPCVRVDETGAVNVFYYDNRNTVAPVMQNYLSRSTDGGATWVDVQITNHNFTPAPIAGTATGYQGDYIGITSGGLGKIFCNWMDNSSGIYQSWIASVDVTKSNICEDFSCANFNPTSNFYLEFSPNNLSSRDNVSAYGIGSGSVKFDFFNLGVGNTTSLYSYEFPAAPANTHITFDLAYAPYSVSFGPDTLLIETSNNGGTTFSTAQTLIGRFDQTGELNTGVPATTSSYIPSSAQWQPRIFSIPAGTNKVRLKAKSGFGNNLYLDNICIQTLPVPSSTGGIGCVPQGFYRPLPFPQTVQDTVRTYLCRTDFPNVKVDSAISYLSTNAVASSPYTRALTGTYYIKVIHRNSIETWSKSGGESYTRGSTLAFNFIQPVNQAYNNNQALIDPVPYYGMYGGDVVRDNVVDLADVSQIENAAFIFSSGYVVEDLTGDNFVDLSDLLIADNNSYNFVTRQAPPGAEPEPQPNVESTTKTLTFENEAQRQKYELSLSLMKGQESQITAAPKKIELSKELKERQNTRMNGKAKVNSLVNPMLNDKNNSTNEKGNRGTKFGSE